MTNSRAARVNGLVFCLMGLGSFIGFIPLLFRVDPFQGGPLHQTQAQIIRISPGRQSQFPRSYTGGYYHYQFAVDGENYHGNFFRRQYTNAIGEFVAVEYREDKPYINRQQGEAGELSRGAVQVLLLILSVITLVGVVMLITGRDFISDWKQRITPRSRARTWQGDEHQ